MLKYLHIISLYVSLVRAPNILKRALLSNRPAYAAVMVAKTNLNWHMI